jgi:hypothetical protein
MTGSGADDDRRRRESKRVLDRVAGESEVVGTSTFARTANRIGQHFAAADTEGQDAAEVWGTRIGRGLALVFVILLLLWLAGTYL